MTSLLFVNENTKPRISILRRVFWRGVWRVEWRCIGFAHGDALTAIGMTPKEAYDQFMIEKHARRPILQKLRDWFRHA